jgi:hypothetical protein
VRDVIASAAGVSFFVPETAFIEAEEHVAALALKRGRDPDIALALLRSPRRLVEDADFFGCGVATCTTDRVQMFLRESSCRLAAPAFRPALALAPEV